MFDTVLVEHLICIKCGTTSLQFEGVNSEVLLTCPKCGENYHTNSKFADFTSNLNLKKQKEWENTLNVYKGFLESFRTETIRTKNLLRESMRAKKRLVEFCGFSGRILDIGCSEGNMCNVLPSDTEYWGIEPIIEPSLSYPFPLFKGVFDFSGLYRGLSLAIMRKHDSAHLHPDFTVEWFQNKVQEIFAQSLQYKLIGNCIYLRVRK